MCACVFVHNIYVVAVVVAAWCTVLAVHGTGGRLAVRLSARREELRERQQAEAEALAAVREQGRAEVAQLEAAARARAAAEVRRRRQPCRPPVSGLSGAAHAVAGGTGAAVCCVGPYLLVRQPVAATQLSTWIDACNHREPRLAASGATDGSCGVVAVPPAVLCCDGDGCAPGGGGPGAVRAGAAHGRRCGAAPSPLCPAASAHPQCVCCVVSC
jgi:hypothetical protein